MIGPNPSQWFTPPPHGDTVDYVEQILLAAQLAAAIRDRQRERLRRSTRRVSTCWPTAYRPPSWRAMVPTSFNRVWERLQPRWWTPGRPPLSSSSGQLGRSACYPSRLPMFTGRRRRGNMDLHRGAGWSDGYHDGRPREQAGVLNFRLRPSTKNTLERNAILAEREHDRRTTSEAGGSAHLRSGFQTGASF